MARWKLNEDETVVFPSFAVLSAIDNLGFLEKLLWTLMQLKSHKWKKREENRTWLLGRAFTFTLNNSLNERPYESNFS